MKELIRTLNKYVILLIVSSIFGMPWFYIKNLIFSNYPNIMIVSYSYSFFDYIPTIAEFLIKITIMVLIIIDCRKENLSNVILTSIATFCYPLLGIVIFSILLLEKQKIKA
jgi:hypothetical protein